MLFPIFKKLPACISFCIVFFIMAVRVNTVQAAIIAHKTTPAGVVFTLDKGQMEVKVCKADIIEVRYTIFNSFQNKPSLVVNAKWAYPAFKLTEDKNEFVISTSRLKMIVNKSPNAISYTPLSGENITAESSDDNKTISTATI